MPSVTVPAGGTISSDPLDFALSPQTKVAVTIAFGSTPGNVTGHPGSRTTSYIATGNAVAAASLSSPVSTEHWYYVTGIDVEAPTTSRAVVTLGDSITDGRGSTTDMNNRWPDNLSRRLRANAPTAAVGVLNQGIGGNAVVTGGLGPTAVSRFQRDVLDQAGVRWVIVLHGVNDIGGASGQAVAQSLITAYQGFVTAARARGVRIYGVPILPIGGSSYDSADHEAARQTERRETSTPSSISTPPCAIQRLRRVYLRPTTAAIACTSALRAISAWPTPSISRCLVSDGANSVAPSDIANAHRATDCGTGGSTPGGGRLRAPPLPRPMRCVRMLYGRLPCDSK
jgi:lysophospholipase L1-like esterase